MIDSDSLLKSLVAEQKSRTTSNTIKFKKFRGGDVKLVGAQSASGLTSDTCRFVAVDECDDHRENVSYAGSSISLAVARQTSYGSLAKTLLVSSPKVKGESEITSWWERGDRRVYMVPCPHCGEYQTLRWKDEGDSGIYRLQWDKGDPDSARYICCHCSRPIEESAKNIMLPAGRWEPTNFSQVDSSVTSYGLNALYLPYGALSWPDLARGWEHAQERLKTGDTTELRTFCNTRLAEPFDPPADSIDPKSLQALIEDGWETTAIPNGVRAIVCATDVQDSRLETLTLGVGLGLECWVLGYNTVLIDPADASAWKQHDQIITKKFTKQDGTVLSPCIALVDSGGHRTEEVYRYTDKRRTWQVYAIKGRAGKWPIWNKKIGRGDKNLRKVNQFHWVGVDSAKEYLTNMLSIRTPGPKYLHIPDWITQVNPDFFVQLTNEKREKKRDSGGREKWTWVKTGPNEVLDTFVYAIAGISALQVSGIDFDSPRQFKSKPKPVTSTPPEQTEVANPIVEQPKPIEQQPIKIDQSLTRPATQRQTISRGSPRPPKNGRPGGGDRFRGGNRW